jgi:cytochrome c551/c552
MEKNANINQLSGLCEIIRNINFGSYWIPNRSEKLKNQFWQERTMPYIKFVSAFLAIFLFCILQPLPLHSQEFLTPENPLKGRFVFEQKGCITCHSIKGEGGNIGPDLGQEKFYGSILHLASIMWNHSPEMLRRMRELDLPYPEFSQNEMGELIAYLYYLRYLEDPGDLYRGKIVLENKGCLTCHSIGGKGEKLAPAFDKLSVYISPIYLAQALWNHSPEMEKELKKKGLKRPKFAKGEIVDLSAYIRSASRGVVREKVYMSPGNPKMGLKVLEEKKCLECHSLKNKKETIGKEFKEMDWNYTVTEIAGLMWNHGSEMGDIMEIKKISWPTFNDKEMADLISYLYFLGLEDKPGDIQAGKTIFSNKGCVNCHGVDGKGLGMAPDLSQSDTFSSSINIAQVMWNHAAKMEEKITEKVLGWPNLSGEEMVNLYSYLHSLSHDSDAKR